MPNLDELLKATDTLIEHQREYVNGLETELAEARSFLSALAARRKALGGPVPQQSPKLPDAIPMNGKPKSHAEVSKPPDSMGLKIDVLAHRNLPDQIQEILRQKGRAMRVPEITSLLESFGITTSSDGGLGMMVSSALGRNTGEGGRFVRVERGVYDLASRHDPLLDGSQPDQKGETSEDPSMT